MSRRNLNIRAKARKPAPQPMTDALRNEPLSINARIRALIDAALSELVA